MPKNKKEPVYHSEESGDEEEEYSEEYSDDEEEDDEDPESSPEVNIDEKTVSRLKKKINDWMDYDDKIKILNEKSKKYKDAKKIHEESIIQMLVKLKIDNKKIDIHDNSNKLRGRVYRHKSVTKEPLKEDIVKDALMEMIRDEKKVNQLVKKIDSKRPIKERYYLKRTKGNN